MPGAARWAGSASFSRTNVEIGASRVTALMRKAEAVPKMPMTMPARAGPTVRVPLNEAELRAIASGRSSLGHEVGDK